MTDVGETSTELGGYFLDVKGAPLSPDEGDSAGTGLVVPKEDLQLGRVHRVPPAPPPDGEATAGQQDRVSFMTLRKTMLQSRDSPHGFDFQAEAICLPVVSPLVWEGY
eukprot:10618110-Alexandrium_andersonii.AAC.1